MNNHLDTHFHLDLWPQPNISTLIEQREIYTIAVTNTPSVYFHTEKITVNSRYIRAALGLHPQLASERQRELSLFMQLLPTTRYIGEIGLDDRTCTDFGIQKKLFIAIINACADAKNKILTIHSRRADKEVVDVIGNQFPGKIILHWFSGSLAMLERGVDAGYYFSVNHAMANSSTGKKIIQAIPSDRLLTESDGPFVEASRKPCSPLSMPSLLHTLVSVRTDLENEVIATNLIFANFRRILS